MLDTLLPVQLALGRSDLPADLRLLSAFGLSRSVERRRDTLATLHFALLCGSFTFVRVPLPLVGGAVPRVRQAFALVRDPLALVGEALAVVRQLLAFHGDPLTLRDDVLALGSNSLAFPSHLNEPIHLVWGPLRLATARGDLLGWISVPIHRDRTFLDGTQA